MIVEENVQKTLGLLLQVLVLALSNEAELGDADNCLLPGSGFRVESAAMLHSGTSSVATSCVMVLLCVVIGSCCCSEYWGVVWLMLELIVFVCLYVHYCGQR